VTTTTTPEGADVRSPAARVVARAQAQADVFAPVPGRAAVYALDRLPADRVVTVRVHRNLAAERLLTPAALLARYGGLRIEASFGPYDDSLSFAELDGPDPDVELVWLDYARLDALGAEDLAALLGHRLRALRLRSNAPIIVLDLAGSDPRADAVNAALRRTADAVPAVFVGPVSEIATQMGAGFLSARAAALTAVPLSPPALMRVAQVLALCWLPAALGVRLRGLAVDLDNTLYRGVLGEDGPDGVVLTDDHRRLQETLKSLHQKGFFLAIVSRNEMADVQNLFARRPDFPLQAADIDAWGVSWGRKSQALHEVAAAVRVAPSTFLFLDDNAGELIEVSEEHPGVSTAFADDPADAVRALALHPGLFTFTDAGVDVLRTADLAAEAARGALRSQAGDPDDYLAALGVELEFTLDDRAGVRRLAELSNKTNQFTTALRRLTEIELAERMDEANARVVSVRVKDKLADSGVIAMISARRQQDGRVLVEDVCVSCRALGRGIEDVLLDTALHRIGVELDAQDLHLAVADGPRNAPARAWLDRLGGRPAPGVVVVRTPVPRPDVPVTATWSAP
jgi:FkbH-like protein